MDDKRTPTTYALQKVLQEMEECYKVYLTQLDLVQFFWQC